MARVEDIPKDVWRYVIAKHLSVLSTMRLRATCSFFLHNIPDKATMYQTSRCVMRTMIRANDAELLDFAITRRVINVDLGVCAASHYENMKLVELFIRRGCTHHEYCNSYLSMMNESEDYSF